jgi:hypothetical protein
MLDFFCHLREHDGVATSATARDFGITWHRERRLLEQGILDRPGHRLVRATSHPQTWRQRCRIATMSAGHGVISHGAAARLHGLDGFDGHEPVDILCKKGSWPGHPGIVITHFTRGLTDDDVVDIDGIPVLSVPTTLALLRPHSGTEATIRAIASAVRDGWPLIELRSTAARWRTRGRPGPSFCIEVLDRLAESGIRAQASTGASISSAADQGSRFKVTTSPVTSSHRSPVQI